MKKVVLFLTLTALLLGLCACGGGTTPTAAPTAAPATQAPAADPTQAPAADPTEAPAATPEPAADPTEAPADPGQDPSEVALSLIDHDVQELYAVIGEPISSDYAPSCLEENSEDGELVYDGFIVLTVRSNETGYEYVYDVDVF